MDPVENLIEQRKIARRILALDDCESRDDGINHSLAADGVELAELVIALDHWRKAGGFDPYKVVS